MFARLAVILAPAGTAKVLPIVFELPTTQPINAPWAVRLQLHW